MVSWLRGLYRHACAGGSREVDECQPSNYLSRGGSRTPSLYRDGRWKPHDLLRVIERDGFNRCFQFIKDSRAARNRLKTKLVRLEFC